MFVRDVNDPEPVHEALYMFKEDRYMYFVSAGSYEKFEAATSSSDREKYADVILNMYTNTIVKSRHS